VHFVAILKSHAMNTHMGGSINAKSFFVHDLVNESKRQFGCTSED